MSVDDNGVTDSCLDYDRNGGENCSTEMAGVMLSLQRSLPSSTNRAEKRLRMRPLRPSRRVSAGKSRLKQQIPNVKSITERWRYFVDFLHDFESFYFPKRFIYLRAIAFSGPYRWNFRKARDFVYFIDPLLCIVASRASFSRHGLLTSR